MHRGVIYSSSGKRLFINYLEFFCTGDLSVLPIVFPTIYSDQYGLLDICLLWVVIQYTLFILFSNCPSVGPWELSDIPPSNKKGFIFESILTFWHYACPSPRISHFFKEPGFLLWKNGIQNQDLGARCHCCHQGHSF